MRASFIAIPLMAVLGFAATSATGQERQGRYVMSPTENGFVRMDTETGAMSLCTRRDDKWTCALMEDDAKGLRDEVATLRAEVKRLQEQAALAGRAPGEAPSAEQPERNLELPTEGDIDRAFDYVERIFRKFRDRMKQFEELERNTPPEKQNGAQL